MKKFKEFCRYIAKMEGEILDLALEEDSSSLKRLNIELASFEFSFRIKNEKIKIFYDGPIIGVADVVTPKDKTYVQALMLFCAFVREKIQHATKEVYPESKERLLEIEKKFCLKAKKALSYKVIASETKIRSVRRLVMDFQESHDLHDLVIENDVITFKDFLTGEKVAICPESSDIFYAVMSDFANFYINRNKKSQKDHFLMIDYERLLQRIF